VVADDHVSVLRSVSDLLAQEFDVLAAVCDGTKAIEAGVKFEPDIFILDIVMPGLSGIQAAREIRKLRRSAKLVFLTIQKDEQYVEAARALGASYVLKSRIYEDLLVALNETLAGRVFVSQFTPR
jgi:DNA-binding NarL/FixJ family response regulator